jgi:hypothetical protein
MPLDSLTTLCNHARDRFELKPEAPADAKIVEEFNSHLARSKNRYSNDRFIQSMPWISGEISNRHMYLRIRNLQGTLLTASNVDDNTEIERRGWRFQAALGVWKTEAAQ